MIEFNAQDDANIELLEKLKHLDVRLENTNKSNSLCKSACWKSLKWKTALNHIGLLVSLSIYCAVGGLLMKASGRGSETGRMCGSETSKLLHTDLEELENIEHIYTAAAMCNNNQTTED
uniref:Uncharacterized protein n=1 Tax=Glossina morsitans morsitans TaxID=37546 RepID=A0A1B0G8B3_GLOMM